MKPEWKEKLLSSGAEFDMAGETRTGNTRVSHYGNADRELRAALGGNTMVDLNHFGLIRAVGADMQTFLQGQFTQDVAAIMNADQSRLGAYCTHKGRMLASFRLFRYGDALLIRLPRLMLEPILSRLQMYVLMSQVTLEDASDALVRIGLSGPSAKQQVERATELPAPAVNTVSRSEQVLVIGVPAKPDFQRYEIYGNLDRMLHIWDRLSVYCARAGADTWGLQGVLAGIPTLHPETQEAFVPQMLNLQRIDGIAFDKGCYIGQEVVARMQYRGELKRRMHLIRHAGPARPGTELFVDNHAVAVGKVVESFAHPDGDYAGLAVLQTAHADKPLKLQSAEGVAVTASAPPYGFGDHTNDAADPAPTG